MPEPIELPTLGKAQRLTTEQTAALAPKLAEAYRNGMSLRAIASDTGRSYGWVHRTLTDFGIDLRPRGSYPLNRPKADPVRGPAGNR